VPEPTFGFVTFAEKINSRAAMIGFFSLLAVEGISGHGLLELIGFSVSVWLGNALLFVECGAPPAAHSLSSSSLLKKCLFMLLLQVGKGLGFEL
jgi:hypothetical protein